MSSRIYSSYTPSSYSGYSSGGSTYASGGTGSYGRSYGYGSSDKFAFWGAASRDRRSSQLGSDTASVRSYGSQRSFGAGASSYKPYDTGTRSSTSGVYSGGSGAGYEPSLRRATSVDRSLSFASTNRGNVASLSGKFAGGSSYGGSDHGRGGYGSDVESTKSYGSYGRSQSSSRSYGGGGTSLSRLRDSSPPRSSSRLSRPDTSRDYQRSSSRDFGASYGASSTSRDYGKSYGSAYTPSTNSRLKNKDYNLTPFATRRTASAKTSDLNLTPFSSRHSHSSQTETKPSYERQSSAASTYSRQSSRDASFSRQSSVEEKKPAEKKSKIIAQKRPSRYADSSESENEPEGGKKDPNFRYLTSRATSPMDPDRDSMEMRQMRKKPERRFIARTKKKKVPTATLR